MGKRWFSSEQHDLLPCSCSGKRGESCTPGIARCHERTRIINAVRNHFGLRAMWDVTPKHVGQMDAKTLLDAAGAPLEVE
jgi:hypothetical protein